MEATLPAALFSAQSTSMHMTGIRGHQSGASVLRWTQTKLALLTRSRRRSEWEHTSTTQRLGWWMCPLRTLAWPWSLQHTQLRTAKILSYSGAMSRGLRKKGIAKTQDDLTDKDLLWDPGNWRIFGQKICFKRSATNAQMLPCSHQIHDRSPVLFLFDAHVIEEDPPLSGWTPEEGHIVHATVADHATVAVHRVDFGLHPENFFHLKLWLDHGKEGPQLVPCWVGTRPNQRQDEGLWATCQPTFKQDRLSTVALAAVVALFLGISKLELLKSRNPSFKAKIAKCHVRNRCSNGCFW